MPELTSLLSGDARVMRSSLIRQLTGLVNQPDIISFAAGSPNAETYPHQQLAEIFNRLVAEEKGRLFQYSVTRGAPELIEAVRARSAEVQGVKASEEETILVSGSQQGLDFVARVLLDPGDAVFVESPSFIGATSAFANFRARLYGVRTGDDGMDLDHLAEQVRAARASGRRPKLVYVIPNFQNPSGRVWSRAGRDALRTLAAREDLLILEDDAYGELYFEAAAAADLRPLKADDSDNRVLYLSTFSKILAGGLRVAWIHGPAEIVRAIELAKETGDLCTSTLSQKLILEFLNRGLMPEQTARVRAFYKAKAAKMSAALDKHLGGRARFRPPRGGLFAWAELDESIDATALFHRALEKSKVAFIPGAPFFVDGSGANTLRLSFSNVSDQNIDSGIERIGRLLAQTD